MHYCSLNDFFLEHDCGDVCSYSHKIIIEVAHLCAMSRSDVQSMLQFIPKAFSGVEVRALSSSSINSAHRVFEEVALGTKLR